MAQYVRVSQNLAPQICFQYIFINCFSKGKSWVVLNSFGIPSSGPPVGIAMLPVSVDYQQIPNQSQITCLLFFRMDTFTFPATNTGRSWIEYTLLVDCINGCRYHNWKTK